MDRLVTHNELQELLGAYAVHALNDYETVLVDEHLPTCAPCRLELDELLEASASLALLSLDDAADYPVDPTMDARILDRIRAQTTIDLTADPTGSHLANSVAGIVSESAIGTATATVLPFDVKRKRTHSRWKMAVASAAAATAISIPLGLSLGGGTTSIAALAKSAAKQQGSQTVALLNDTKGVVAEVVLTTGGQAYLRNTSLPELTDGTTYQLWTINDGTAISAGVMGPNPKTVAFFSGAKPRTFAITVEKSAGTPASVESPVAVGTISS
jgi:Anti-sigma-K factor rskA